jgi:acyl carrier protein
MNDREAVYSMLSELISRTTGQAQIVVAETALSSLGFDSLGLIEIIFELEERYDVTLPFNANEIAQKGREANVGDIVEMVIMARDSTAAQ